MKCWLQTAKAGDVLAILPILHAEYLRTGQPQNLVIAREYASIVEGLDYVTPTIFPGDWHDFKEAYKFAKQRFDSVVVSQIHEIGMKSERKHPSVFLDMWDRCGYLEQWDLLPLVLPRTGKVQLSAPTIFYADHSQSSPFFYKDELFKLLKETFPNHQIMRASGMRLKNLRDFLPIMDACSLIVSVETSFLHLSAATKTPVIALVCDKPDPWRGSPWSKRFAFHCRYGDFLTRKVELVAAMNRAVNKCSITQPEILGTDRPFGYNATMMDGDKFIYRHHPNGTWKTKLAIDDGSGPTTDIQFPKECDDYSVEDGRFFTLNGKPHLSYTCATAIGGYFKCIQAFGPLAQVDGQWRITKHVVPNVPGNDFSGLQKNYVPFESDGKLFLLYGIKGNEQIVLEMDGAKVVKARSSPAPVWDWGTIRGGAMIPYKGHWLRVFHSRVGAGHRHYDFTYYIGASLMEMQPPFKTVMVSSFPILAGDERYVHGCKHWKPRVVFPLGLVLDGDGFQVSLGINDSMSGILRLQFSDLHL